MTPTGKKKLVKSLTVFLQKWLEETDPNSEDETDIGFIGNDIEVKLAALVITALEINSDSQRQAQQNGFLTTGEPA